MPQGLHGDEIWQLYDFENHGHSHRFACRPVRVVPDPIRGSDSVLVLCMVMNPDSTPHETNERHKLMQQVTDEVKAQECLFGFEQVRACFLAVFGLGDIHSSVRGGLLNPSMHAQILYPSGLVVFFSF